MTKTSQQILGMVVVGAGGRVFGHVDELEIETEHLRITTITVKVTSAAVTELGIKKPFWSSAKLVVHAADVQGITDVVVLRLSIETFADRLGTAAADAS